MLHFSSLHILLTFVDSFPILFLRILFLRIYLMMLLRILFFQAISHLLCLLWILSLCLFLFLLVFIYWDFVWLVWILCLLCLFRLSSKHLISILFTCFSPTPFDFSLFSFLLFLCFFRLGWFPLSKSSTVWLLCSLFTSLFRSPSHTY